MSECNFVQFEVQLSHLMIIWYHSRKSLEKYLTQTTVGRVHRGSDISIAHNPGLAVTLKYNLFI